MSYRCPNCKSDIGLYREMEIPGWEAIDGSLAKTGERDHDWFMAEPTGTYGCGECEWQGMKLEQVGIDGDPLPFIHAGQLEIDAAA